MLKFFLSSLFAFSWLCILNKGFKAPNKRFLIPSKEFFYSKDMFLSSYADQCAPMML
jgi:hypothetical protein